MPPLFDDMQLAAAIHNEVIPSIKRLAESASLRARTLRRFDNDEPPRYISSTEEEEEDEFSPSLGPTNPAVLDKLKNLLDKPLNNHERQDAVRHAQFLYDLYDPGVRYDKEVRLEKDRIYSWTKYEGSSDMWDYWIQLGPAKKGRAGGERINIIARHYIKRRWQKLGVWNPEWGIPGIMNSPQPKDDASKWKWPWQHGNAAGESSPGFEALSLNPQHPTTRAFRLREGLRRHERNPVLPHSHLQGDESAVQAESFLLSRPWFMFAVERGEEAVRYDRIPIRGRRLYKGGQILERWKERGDWKSDWRDPGGTILIGWKWPYESPSPEPEDFSGLDDLDTLELTPSEVDALEAVPPPSPPTPRTAYIPPRSPEPSLFNSLPLVPLSTALSDPVDGPEEAAEWPPSPRQRRRRNQQHDANSAQPLRRSARIAAMATDYPPPLSSPSPPTIRLPRQQRRQRTRSTARPTSARPPAVPPTAQNSKRGRPRKVNNLADESKPPAQPRRSAQKDHGSKVGGKKFLREGRG